MTMIEVENYLTDVELKDKNLTESMRIKLAKHRAVKRLPFENKIVKKAIASLPKMNKEQRAKLDDLIKKEEELEKHQELLRRWELLKEYIPRKFFKAKLKPFELNGQFSPNQEKILKEIFNKSLHLNPQSILFTGSSGVGKTHFSVALGIRYIYANKVVRFIQDKDFVELKPWMKPQYETCEVLILDDIAGDGDYGRIAPWESKQIRNLIYDRSDKGLKTLISTNFSLKDLEKYLGARTWSRFTNDFVFGNGFEYIDFGDSAGLRGLV